MFVDPVFNVPDPEDGGMGTILSAISQERSTGRVFPTKIEDGVFQINHFSGDLLLRHRPQYDDEFFETPDGISSYGVCDSWEQLKPLLPKTIQSKDCFVIFLTCIKKSEEPSDGGWRWHKWGKYVGVQEPAQEYLYDEAHIEEVYIFHIYKLNSNDSGGN